MPPGCKILFNSNDTATSLYAFHFGYSSYLRSTIGKFPQQLYTHAVTLFHVVVMTSILISKLNRAATSLFGIKLDNLYNKTCLTAVVSYKWQTVVSLCFS